MNPILALGLLILCAGTLFALPLIPAIVELRTKSDAQPLSVIQKHTGEIRYFADSFRAYLQKIETTLDDCSSSGLAATTSMPDGSDVLVLGRGEQALTLPLKERNELSPMIIAAGTDLLLPPGTAFSKDIYSRGQVIGGPKNTYRAILAEKEVYFGEGSRLLRWVHAVGEFNADADCDLLGRVSSDQAVRLGGGCNFKRLNAPYVVTGQETLAFAHSTKMTEDDALPESMSRSLHDGDYEISPGEVFRGNLVVRGNLYIGEQAHVYGSVKGVKNVVLDGGVTVEGSLISADRLQIGVDCTIHGPVIAEHEMVIRGGTRCGSPDIPTTVSAPEIELEEGVVIFGTLWAREHGQVVSRA